MTNGYCPYDHIIFLLIVFYFNLNYVKGKESQSVNGYVVWWTEELFIKKKLVIYLFIIVVCYDIFIIDLSEVLKVIITIMWFVFLFYCFLIFFII